MNDPRELQRWSKRVADSIEGLGREVRDLRQFQAAILNKQQLEAAQELVEKLQGHSLSYSNLIIAAGYAGFFALWTTLDDDLPAWLHALAGLMITVSLLTFIGWEVAKMIWGAIHLNGVQKRLVSKPQGPQTFKEFQDALANYERRTYRLWPWFLVPSVVFGLGAGACLLAFFAVKLWSNVV